MIRIAVIEDDRNLNDGIVLALKNEEYIFEQYYDLQSARRMEPVDVIILDINLPDGSGFDFLKELKADGARRDVPVIVLTANDLETDELKGLQLGADDYITKPFSLMVLRARIEKALRGGVPARLYTQDDFRFDFDRMKFARGGREIDLSKTEQKLLRVLTDNAGITMARSRLMELVWEDGGEYVDENALSVTVKRLRDKLEEDSAKPIYLQTVYGSGYVWRKP